MKIITMNNYIEILDDNELIHIKEEFILYSQ